jgi:hypothetical protein
MLMPGITFSAADRALVDEALLHFDPETALSGLRARDSMSADDWQYFMSRTREDLRAAIWLSLISKAVMTGLPGTGLRLNEDEVSGSGSESVRRHLRDIFLAEVMYIPTTSPSDRDRELRVAEELNNINDLSTGRESPISVGGQRVVMYKTLDDEFSDALYELVETAAEWVSERAEG